MQLGFHFIWGYLVKNRYKIIALIVFGVFQYALPAFNPFKGDDWKHVGSKIKSGFNKATNKIKGGFSKGLDKAKACSEVVALGSEWAAKQAGLQAAKKILITSETLQKTDPRLVGLLTAEKSAEAALKVAQGTLEAAQKASEGIAKGTKLMGDIVSQGFNIESISFKSTSEQLMKNEPLPFNIVGTIAGRHFDTTIKGVDFSSSDAFVSSILKNLDL